MGASMGQIEIGGQHGLVGGSELSRGGCGDCYTSRPSFAQQRKQLGGHEMPVPAKPAAVGATHLSTTVAQIMLLLTTRAQVQVLVGSKLTMPLPPS